ncbi:MAG: hypothetical protein ACR2J5_06630 [Geodermatophilaceae bacterium]
MSMPPNQPPMGGYPQSGEGGYHPGGPPGSGGPSQSGWSAGPDPTQQYGQPTYGAPPSGYQPADVFTPAQGGYGQPDPQWGQPAGYPGGGGYGSGGPPPKRSPLPWIIGVLVALLVAGGVLLFFLLKDDSPTTVATTTSATSSAEPTTEEETTEEENTEEETTEETGSPTPTPEVGPPPPAGAPAPVGSGDANIDALAQGCFSGDMQACDDLYEATAGPDADNPDPTPELEPFFDYAFTCGDRLTETEVAKRFCLEIYPDA